MFVDPVKEITLTSGCWTKASPAFDPRPGRTNVNQTSDLDIALPVVTSGTYVLYYMVFVFHEKIRMTVNS